jgi:putative endonuclease
LIEHRDGTVPGFTSRYRIFRLVHFEQFSDIRAAIDREKKISLIERRNRTWQDLTPRQKADPSPPFAKAATGFGMTS